MTMGKQQQKFCVTSVSPVSIYFCTDTAIMNITLDLVDCLLETKTKFQSYKFDLFESPCLPRRLFDHFSKAVSWLQTVECILMVMAFCVAGSWHFAIPGVFRLSVSSLHWHISLQFSLQCLLNKSIEREEEVGTIKSPVLKLSAQVEPKVANSSFLTAFYKTKLAPVGGSKKLTMPITKL